MGALAGTTQFQKGLIMKYGGNRKKTWDADRLHPNCSKCSRRFTAFFRRHHCRACGLVFCGTCCPPHLKKKAAGYNAAGK